MTWAHMQLLRLGLLCGMIFTFSALGADGVPPLLQVRGVLLKGLHCAVALGTPTWSLSARLKLL